MSLGGVNGLKIPVEKTANSTLGAAIDGALANEFFVALRRSEYRARGHSGKEPWAIAKNATYGESNLPAQLRIHRKLGIRLWDAHDRETKTEGGSIQFQASLNVDLPVRFAAKVALAAGYFVYGDLFRHEVDHQQLREVLGVDPSMVPLQDTSNDHGFDHLTLRADHYLSGPLSENDWQLRCLRSFCSNRKGSLIVLVPGQNSLRVAVGILGEYLAMVNVPAHTKTLPNEGAYSWGHVLDVVDRRLIRYSWAEGFKQWAAASGTN